LQTCDCSIRVTVVLKYIKSAFSVYFPKIALFLDEVLRKYIKHIRSYDLSNLKIWKGNKICFRRSGHICTCDNLQICLSHVVVLIVFVCQWPWSTHLHSWMLSLYVTGSAKRGLIAFPIASIWQSITWLLSTVQTSNLVTTKLRGLVSWHIWMNWGYGCLSFMFE